MLYILIPAHNNKKEVMDLLACLDRQTRKSFCVVLVDDGSTDGTEVSVKRSFPATEILKGDGNLWWTGANVLGINHILPKAQDDDYVLLLNNDLLVDENYIEILVQAAESHKNALIGSTLVDTNNRDFMESGVRLDHALQLTINRDRAQIETTEFDLDVDVLPGRGTLVPIPVYKRSGNFNLLKLPHYGADYEFSVRAKRAGFRLLVSHKAKVFANLNITGIVSSNKKIISLKECSMLLFSKKSKSNLRYYLNFVWLCSEKQYRVINVTNSARGILSQTILKTIPGYPFLIIWSFLKIIRRLLAFISGFLYRSYPLRRIDIGRYGLDTQVLLEQGMLVKQSYRSSSFYFLNSDKGPGNLSQDQKLNLKRLRQLSFNYKHKIHIVIDKLTILFSSEAAE
jgi:GT2 family glycosyltransferase